MDWVYSIPEIQEIIDYFSSIPGVSQVLYHKSYLVSLNVGMKPSLSAVVARSGASSSATLEIPEIRLYNFISRRIRNQNV